MEEHLNTNQTTIVIYHFFDLTDADYFCRLLEGRFRSSGHTRRIVFRKWNCYHELPGQDADILVYDAIVMSALAEKGFLHQLPEIINIDGMFSWLIDKSKVRKKTYGIPLMLCANALICRKKDDQKVNNIMDIHEPTAIALHSMVMFYYLQSFCNYQDRPEKIHAVFEHLVGLVGGRDLVERSHLSDYDGISRFNRRECRYFLGYTENIRLFEPDEYIVRFANFSDFEEDRMPLFMADFASLGNHVREEKLLDCLDLLEIMTDAEFIYDLCVQEGRLQYMLPACRSVYPRLAELDPLYGSLYEMLKNEENGIFRYGPQFYEEFYRKADLMLKTLKGQDDRKEDQYENTADPGTAD